jgi:cytochrome c oxidase assembly protein subunit 15
MTSPFSRLCLWTSVLILVQLVLGATMRHQHAGLAIPDFPLAYGKLWPPMDAQSVAHYNQRRLEVVDLNPITSAQIGMQMVHRLVALSILCATAYCAWFAKRRLGNRNIASRLALAWFLLVVLQALLGAATIWSNKAADIATGHVMLGALSLGLGTLLTLIAANQRASLSPAPVLSARLGNEPSGSFGARPARAGN